MKISRKFIKVFLTLVVIILFTPIPYINSADYACAPCAYKDYNKCPHCPKKGDIIFSRPLITQFILSIQSKSEYRLENTIPVTENQE